jgi:hypothetical protein
MTKSVYGHFQGQPVSIFLMAPMKTLAPARTIDWDVISQRVKEEIFQALTGEEHL